MIRRVPPSIAMLGFTLAAISLASSCRCGARSSSIASVISLDPVTEIATAGASWRDAARADDLFLGDSLRTGERGRAEIRIRGRGELDIAPSSLVRFTSLSGAAEGSPELQLVIEAGSLEATSADELDAPLLIIDGPGGRVRVRRGASARVAVDDDRRMRLEVLVGVAQLEQEGASRDVEAGTTLMLSVGEAELVAPEPDVVERRDAAAEVTDAETAELDAEATAEEEQAESVRLLLRGGTKILVRAPGQEEFSRPSGRRPTLEPGSIVRVSGGDGVEIGGPGGASVLLRDGAEAVVLGQSGERLRVRLNGGGCEARSAGAGVAALSLPGGHVETTRPGGFAALRAVVVDRTSSRVNVNSGMATIRARDQVEQAETGSEILLTAENSFSVLPAREIHPVLRSGSAMIHDPRARGGFTVRFPPIEGCERYLVKVQHRGSRFVEAVTSRPLVPLTDLGYGEFRWQATCSGAEEAAESREGRVARLADRSGHAPMPTKAPHNRLDSTGRSYTVMYQNRLPAISLVWSAAPAAPSYRLEVYDDNSGSRVHSRSSQRAAHSFRSGVFSEGRYYWLFRAEGGEAAGASPVSRFRIAFDNVMPAIHIIEPRNGAAASGSVRVRGVVAVGSTVQANGVSLELSGDYRFDQEVPVGPGNLVIFRVTTRGRGTGLYLRHLGR